MSALPRHRVLSYGGYGVRLIPDVPSRRRERLPGRERAPSRRAAAPADCARVRSASRVPRFGPPALRPCTCLVRCRCAMAAAAQRSPYDKAVFVNWFPLQPMLVESEQDHMDARLHWLVAVGSDAAARTEADRLLISLGAPSPEAPEPTRFASLTVESATAVCRLLLYGTLTERLKAAFVLHVHLNNEKQKAPGVLAPATLDALCVAAVSEVYVPPKDSDCRHELSTIEMHGIVTGAMRLLPPSASSAEAVRAALAGLSALSLTMVSNLLAVVVRLGDGAAAAAAVRRVFQLKVHTECLKMGRKDPSGRMGLPALEQQRRLLAMLTLNNIISSAVMVQPQPKELDKLIEDARAVALAALTDVASRRHLRAAAACLMSGVVSPPRAKAEALAAGAMRHLVAVYSGADVFSTHSRTMALMAAGNMSYAASNAAMIEPHTTYLFAQLRRYAAQLSLLNYVEEQAMLYRILFAMGQIASFADFRPLFEQNANMAAMTAVMQSVLGRPGFGPLVTSNLVTRLMTPPVPLAGDVSKLQVEVLTGEQPVGKYVAGGEREVEPDAVAGRCGGCAARGLHFKLCSACRAVSYCGPECQRAAWKDHKAACRAAVAAREHARLVTKVDSSDGGLEKVGKKLHKHAEDNK